jgi:heptaprenyl diphosphate synthase
MQMVTAQRFSGPRAAVESAGVDLTAELDQVEEALRATLVDTQNAFITRAATHLIDAGGKRFRPMMALLGAQFGPAESKAEDLLAGSSSNAAVDAAVVAELVHVATLYHDDVMDEAPVRHGVVTANTRWNNTIAVLLGDYLLARAADLGANLGDEAMKLQVSTLRRLVRGQIDETIGAAEGVDRIGHCLRVMSDKSASLISMAARLGAMVGGADPHVTKALEMYGELLGVAFQIADDILDIAATEDELGKKPGTDLREGIVTLPVLYAVADNPALADVVLNGPITDDASREFALDLLRCSAGLQRAREEAARYAERAKDMLYDLPDIPARAALYALCDFAIGRAF